MCVSPTNLNTSITATINFTQTKSRNGWKMSDVQPLFHALFLFTNLLSIPETSQDYKNSIKLEILKLPEAPAMATVPVGDSVPCRNDSF